MCKTIVDRWVREMEISQGRSKNTISSYVSDLNRFKDYILKKKSSDNFDDVIGEINYMDVEDYKFYLIEDLGFQKSTVNRNINSLKSFFGYTKRYIGKNPCEELKTMNNVTTKKKDLITKEQVLRLLEATEKREGRQIYFDYISKRNKFIISLLATSGLRAEELLTIKKEKIIDFGNYARVAIDCHEEGKTKLNKNIVICGITYDYYKEYLEEYNKKFSYNNDSYLILSGTGKKVNKKDTINLLKKYAERIGMQENLSNHCFRMFANHQLIGLGANDVVRNKIMGWSDNSVASNNYWDDNSKQADEAKIKYVSKILK